MPIDSQRLLTLLFAIAGGQVALGEQPDVSFRRDVRPILAEHCFACHGSDADSRKANLRLDTREGALSDLGGYQPVVPGSRDESALWERITADDMARRMPPQEANKPLSDEQREILGLWIDGGAEYEAHRAYVPPVDRAPPEVNNDAWIRNPIDAFVLAKLESAGLQPAPEADARTLVRRLSFDLTGLPPFQELLEVLPGRGDSGPIDDSRYERAVDSLLASPAYGERMAMYWLDLVRYADSVGYHGDQEISVSPFRDYVISAFNSNLPFDLFSREQLGGDLLAAPTMQQMVASGYNRLGMMSAEGGVQPKEYLAKYAAERVRNASVVWLAATMGCAECHDHKFDPFTQHDFYSFAAFFADIKERGLYAGANSDGDFGPKIAVPTLEQAVELQRLRDDIQQSKQQLAGSPKPSPEERQKLQDKIKEAKQKKEVLESSLVTTHVTVAVEPRTMRVLPRGNWMDDSGRIVEPAVPHFLPRIEKQGRANRRDLADWLFDSENPLTARVFVNRIWKLLFGRGIVASLDDFGVQGSEPTHPELLDHLAVTFRDSGWNVKQLIKYIAMSSTYRQASNCDEALRARDPYNKLLARQGRFRLNAEMIRDNALVLGGLLVDKVGGPSVKPYQPAGYYAHLNFPEREYQPSTGDSLWRRSVYTHWQRQFLHPSLLMFDASSREECTVARPISNTPLAALVLLNDPIYVEAARGLAERMLCDGGASLPEQISFAVRQAVGRPPTADELAVMTETYEAYYEAMRHNPASASVLNDVGARDAPPQLDAVELAAMTGVARVILNLHETITRY